MTEPLAHGAWIPLDTVPIEQFAISASQASALLKISPNTWRGWVSRGVAPKKDGNFDERTPFWYLTTIVEYARNAPGGRLGYPVG